MISCIFPNIAKNNFLRAKRQDGKNELFSFVIWLFIGMSVAFAYQFYKRWDFGDIASVDLFIIATISWLSASIAYNYWSKSIFLSTHLSENGCTVGDFHLTLSDEGIREVHKCVTALFKWDTVLKAEDNQNYIFIFIDNRRAIIIPKRDLTQEEQLGGAWF